MSRSEMTPPTTVGRPSSLAAIRGLTAAVELTDWYLGARVDFREQSAMAVRLQLPRKKAPNPTDFWQSLAAANDVVRRMFRRFSAAVATSREDRRSPRSGPASQRRRRDREPAQPEKWSPECGR